MSRLTRDGTAEPVSRDQILRHVRGQENIHFPCSAGHEQDWQLYPVDLYSAISDDHTQIHTYYRELHSFELTRSLSPATLPSCMYASLMSPLWQVSSFGKAVQVLGEDVGKGTCATPCRTFFSCSGQNSPAPNGFCSQESAAIEEFPKASPLSGGVVRGPEVKGRLTTSEGSRIGKLGGVVESTPWRSDRSKQAPHVAGRAETSDLWVNAGMPGISLAEWSLQSCDEADDGAVGVEHTFSTFANTLGVFLDSRG